MTRSAMSAITALCVMTIGQRADLAVHLLDRLEHGDAGLHVERARRLVAKQHLRPLRDRPRDGHALLLAAGHLRREMVAAIAQLHEGERFLRVHRVARDVGDQRDVLLRGEARDEIVELEDEADRVAAEIA